MSDILGRGPMTQNKCQIASSLRGNSKLIWIFICEDVLSLVTLISLFHLIRSPNFQRLVALLSKSLKTISIIAFLFYFARSIGNLIVYGYSTVLYICEFNQCDYVWSNLTCYLIGYLNKSCSIGFTIFHVASLIERVNATFNLWKRTWMFSCILSVFMLLAPLLFAWIVLKDYSYGGYQVYCYIGTPETARAVLFSKNLLFITDVVSMIGGLILFIYNKYQLKRKIGKYNLKKTFELREMEISIKIIFPMTLIHTLCLIPYFTLSSITLQDSVRADIMKYIFFTEYYLLAKSFYASIVPLSVCILHRFIRSRRVMNEWNLTSINQANQHFQQLQKYFETAGQRK